MCVDTIMPTKCFTKATKQGKKYTACVDTKTFKKKGVKGNAKSKKPTAKGVMVVRKKIKTTRKLKNKSTIKPTLAKSKPKPKPKAPKKLSAGKAVLLTQMGFMKGVGAYAIPKKEKERRINVAKKSLIRNVRLSNTMLGDKIRERKSRWGYDRGEEVSSHVSEEEIPAWEAHQRKIRINYKNKIAKKSLKSLKNKRKKLTMLMTDYERKGGTINKRMGRSNKAYGEDPIGMIKEIDEEIEANEKILKTPDKKIYPTTYKKGRISYLKRKIKEEEAYEREENNDAQDFKERRNRQKKAWKRELTRLKSPPPPTYFEQILALRRGN